MFGSRRVAGVAGSRHGVLGFPFVADPDRDLSGAGRSDDVLATKGALRSRAAVVSCATTASRWPGLVVKQAINPYGISEHQVAVRLRRWAGWRRSLAILPGLAGM